MRIELPGCDDPELSVVMVTHGAWPLIERALCELVEHTRRRFELIVVDNASDQDTRVQLSRLSGARLVANESNRGFGPAANQGAEQGRGEYLVLLNSDAFVHPGWLEPLLEALAEPTVGAVVPCYLDPDGSLQEAGVLLARDGTVRLYGEGDDPERGCYRFRRRIDYGSGVCLAMRLATFAELGGFDEAFAPAYYEDTDFCLRLAARGRIVVYEPRSRVTHVRYGSGNRDRAIELSERNRQLFAERWGSQLGGRPPTLRYASEQTVIAARDALARPRILICSGADRAAVHRLAAALLDGWPRSRLTWSIDAALRAGSEFDQWFARGVEVLEADDPEWLSHRLFHYDLVVTDGDIDAALQAAIERSQPQASRLALDWLADPPHALLKRLVPALAAAGIAPE